MLAYDCDADALHRINKTKDKRNIFVGTNRRDGGEHFITKCRSAGIQTSILVFCMNTTNWIPMSNVTISTSGAAVQKFIRDVVLKH
jgi:hypothetical protein